MHPIAFNILSQIYYPVNEKYYPGDVYMLAVEKAENDSHLRAEIEQLTENYIQKYCEEILKKKQRAGEKV